ncbi:MAG TPA: MCE family protein [Pseudonocardia sp.]|jgi:phospholipid/cholesterol/gamma-HCH transport system substrate-binding protein
MSARRIGRPRALAAKIGALASLGALLGGCGSLSLAGIPLPGGADLGGKPFSIVVQLHNAEDLVPQAMVKVNNVPVGRVDTITLHQPNWVADVHMVINGSVQLPENATAQLRQTSLLGEKYVVLFPPTDEPPRGQLHDGSVVPVTRTNRFPETEEIFGALSLLLNGGGVGQVQQIAIELNKALSGREANTRALLDDLNLLVTTLDGQKDNITRALDGLNQLSASLDQQRGNLDVVLTDLQPGLAVLSAQRPQLVGMLHALDKLSDVATHVVRRSHDDLVHDLYSLRPTLRELARSGDDLPKALQVLVTVPFVDSAAGSARGSFMNLDLQLDLIPQDIADNLANASTIRQSLPTPLNMLPIIPQRLPLLAGSHGLSPLKESGFLPGLGGN